MNISFPVPSANQALNSTPTKNQVPSKDSTGKFGDILTQTMQVNQDSKSSNSEVSSEQMQELKSLLEFLKLDSISEIENGDELANETLGNLEAVLENPILKQLLGDQSIDSILASIMALNNVNTENKADFTLIIKENGNSDLIQQVQQVIEQLFNQMNNTSLIKEQLPNVENVLKLGKILTLLKNHLDLSNKQVDQIDVLKQSVDKMMAKLEQVVGSANKQTSFVSMLDRQSNNVQAFVQNVRAGLVNPNLNGGFSQSQTNLDTALTKGSEGVVSHNPFLSMSKVEQYVLTVPSTKAPINSEELMKSFESLLSRAKFTNSNGIQKLFIKLNPENLGTLRIELIQKDGVMMAKLIASTKAGRDILDSQLQGLKQSFVNQNISVDKIEIAQSFSNFSQERSLQREQNQQHNQQNQPEKVVEEEEMMEDFQHQFLDALIEAEA